MENFDFVITKKEILENLKYKNNSVPVFWYETFYSGSESITGNIPYLGNFILSFTNQGDLTRVLIRSAYGYKEYKLPSRVITNIQTYLYFCVAKYFLDTFDTDIDRSEKESGKFLGFFGFNRTRMIKESFIPDKKVSKDNKLSIFDYAAEKKTRIQEHLKKTDMKDLRKIFYMCNDKQELFYLDKMTSDKHINVILDVDIDKKLFGQRLNAKENKKQRKILQKHKSKLKDVHAKYFSILELLITELNYFMLLVTAENDIIKPLRDNKSTERQIFVKNMFGNVEKIAEFEKKFINELFKAVSEDENLLIKFNNNTENDKLQTLQQHLATKILITTAEQSFINEKIDFHFSDCSKERNENIQIENTIKKILHLVLKTNFNVYSDYIINENHYKENIDKLKHTHPYKTYLDHKSLDHILAAPIQRLTRYTLLLTEMIAVTQNQEIDNLGLGAVEKIDSLLRDIDRIKDDRFRQDFCFHIQQSVVYCPASIIQEKRKFIDYLDTSYETFFLFNDSLLCTQRLCSETKINNLQSKGYEFRSFCMLKNISLYKKTTSIYKIMVKEPIFSAVNKNKPHQFIFKFFENTQSVEFLEKLYLYKSQAYTSAESEVYLKRSMHDYIFFFDNMSSTRSDFTIRITDQRKNVVVHDDLVIVIEDSVYLHYKNATHKIKVEELYNNFYYYLSKIFEYKTIAKGDCTSDMLIFESNLNDINKFNGETYKLTAPYKNSLIKNECNDFEEIIFKIRKTFRRDHTSRESILYENIRPEQLYNINENAYESDLIAQSVMIYNFWRQTLMKHLSFEDFERANANIANYTTLADFKKNICIDQKSILFDMIDHFIQVYKIVKYPCIANVFACLFTKATTVQIKRFVERVSQI